MPSVEYIAGLFDGEGSISISKRENRLILQLTNTDEQAVKAVYDVLKVGSVHRRNRLTVTGKKVYTWVVSGRKASLALKAMLPFLITKRVRAELALEVHVGQVGIHISDVESQHREMLRLQITALNS